MGPRSSPYRTRSRTVCGPSRKVLVGSSGVSSNCGRVSRRGRRARCARDGQQADAGAWRGEIVVVAEKPGRRCRRERGGTDPAPALQVEARAEVSLEEVEVDVVQLLVEIGRRVDSASNSGGRLASSVVDVVQRTDIERAQPGLPTDYRRG